MICCLVLQESWLPCPENYVYGLLSGCGVPRKPLWSMASLLFEWLVIHLKLPFELMFTGNIVAASQAFSISVFHKNRCGFSICFKSVQQRYLLLVLLLIILIILVVVIVVLYYAHDSEWHATRTHRKWSGVVPGNIFVECLLWAVAEISGQVLNLINLIYPLSRPRSPIQKAIAFYSGIKT